MRESNTTTGPTKVFPIFSKDRGPSDVSGAITSPASLQDSVDSLAPNTQPLRRRPVKRVAREDSLSCGTSSQLSNGLPADVINVDDHDLPPTPQFCSQGPGTQEEPITIESSPIKSTKPTVPVHSFFAPRKAIEIESLSITKAKGTSSRIPEIADSACLVAWHAEAVLVGREVSIITISPHPLVISTHQTTHLCEGGQL